MKTPSIAKVLEGKKTSKNEEVPRTLEISKSSNDSSKDNSSSSNKKNSKKKERFQEFQTHKSQRQKTKNNLVDVTTTTTKSHQRKARSVVTKKIAKRSILRLPLEKTTTTLKN